MARVSSIAQAVRDLAGGKDQFEVEAASVRALLAELEPLRLEPDLVRDGEPSRWNSAADKRWIPIRPELVAEVAYDQMEKGRFRHTVKFLRWRPAPITSVAALVRAVGCTRHSGPGRCGAQAAHSTLTGQKV